MKTLKKIALIMLSVMMICSMSVFAADSPTKQTLTTFLFSLPFHSRSHIHNHIYWRICHNICHRRGS